MFNLTSSDKVKSSKSHTAIGSNYYSSLSACVNGNFVQEGGIAAGKSLGVYSTETISEEMEIEFHR